MSSSTHLARVRKLPCIVCLKIGMDQTTDTVAHHLESIRDADSDFAAVALCGYHHELLHHLSRRGWEMRTKLNEIDMLKLTIKGLHKAP